MPPIAPPMIVALEWVVCVAVVEERGTGVFDCVAIAAERHSMGLERQRQKLKRSLCLFGSS